MEVGAPQPQSASGGILAFLRGSKRDDEKSPLEAGGDGDPIAPDARTARGANAEPSSDLRGLGIGRTLDIQA